MPDDNRNGKPVSVKFSAEERAFIEELHRRTGLSRVDIVQRAMVLLRREVEKRGNLGFMLEELNPQGSEKVKLLAETDDVPYGARGKKKP